MSNTINILIAIDTDAVKKNCKPSKEQTNPTGIAHAMGYMVASGATVISGQGTGDLNIRALKGDIVRAFATSGSDNFEDSVLLYGLPRYSGQQVFGPFEYKKFIKSTVVPGSDTTVLPPKITERVFWVYEADVIKAGTENYKVQFALYTRDDKTGQPVLFGYYEWDPAITVPV